MKLLKKIFPVVFLGLVFLVSATPAVAQTSSWSGVCVGEAGTHASDVATIQGLQCMVANVLASFLTLIGIAAFIMLVVSAFRILFSGGNSQNVEKAQKSITFAVIGLIVAISAFAILNLVASFTGVDTILEFRIPTETKQLKEGADTLRSGKGN